MRRLPALLLLLAFVPAALPGADAPVPDEARLRAMTARFVPRRAVPAVGQQRVLGCFSSEGMLTR